MNAKGYYEEMEEEAKAECDCPACVRKNEVEREPLQFNEKVSQVYSGRQDGCRCGCLGEYYEPGDKSFERMARKVINIMNADLENVDWPDMDDPNPSFGERNWNYEMPSGRVYTIYYEVD